MMMYVVGSNAFAKGVLSLVNCINKFDMKLGEQL